MACRRDSASASRSPRFWVAKACISSTTTRFSPSNSVRLSSKLRSRERLSGVVSRILGGLARWRRLRSDGVSPLRVSIVRSRPISSTGVNRLRCTSCANAFSGEIYSVCSPCGRSPSPMREGQKAANVGRNPASVLPAPVSATSMACFPASEAPSISAWCCRTRQSRPVNHSVISGGMAEAVTIFKR